MLHGTASIQNTSKRPLGQRLHHGTAVPRRQGRVVHGLDRFLDQHRQSDRVKFTFGEVRFHLFIMKPWNGFERRAGDFQCRGITGEPRGGDAGFGEIPRLSTRNF